MDLDKEIIEIIELFDRDDIIEILSLCEELVKNIKSTDERNDPENLQISFYKSAICLAMIAPLYIKFFKQHEKKLLDFVTACKKECLIDE
jgi:hypothetical protein